MGIVETRLQKEEIALLDRLYNLRSDESAILEEINRSKEEKKNDKENTERQQSELETEIQELTARKDTLEEQYAKFVEDLKGLDKENYSVLLEELEEIFDPQAMVKSSQEKFPSKIESIQQNITSKQDGASELKDRISQLEIEIGELDERFANAKSDKENLDDLLKELLKGNQNVTVQQVNDLLSALRFTKAESRECGKILLFSDSLTIYDEIVQGKENAGKGINELLSEAKENAAKEEDLEILTDTTKKKKEEKLVEEELPKEDQEAVTLEVEQEIKNDELKDIIEEYSLNKDMFSDEDYQELSKIDSETLKEILEELKKLDMPATIEMLKDAELVEKINLLKENGKKDIDIKLNMNIILNNSLDEIINKIKKLQKAGINEFSIIVLEDNNVDSLIDNLSALNEKGIILDEKELGRFVAPAYLDTRLFSTNLRLISEYGLSLKKSNGKTAIEVLAHGAKKLVDTIDAAIESGEEDILVNNSELISQDIIDVLKRIGFVKESGAEYKKDGKYRQVIGNASKFTEQAGNVNLDSYVVETKDNNESLKNIIGNENIISLLSTYYESDDYGIEPTADEETLLKYHSLVQMVEDIAEKTKYAYKINDINFSINKFRRNALYLLNNNSEMKNCY